uniref:Uncharacterized protein n=1 Tax=Oryzias sinensis TaxID=183150 RepID=A0A8C7X7Q6_9TELE
YYYRNARKKLFPVKNICTCLHICFFYQLSFHSKDSYTSQISDHVHSPSGSTLGCQSFRTLFSSSPNCWKHESLKRSSLRPLAKC